MLKLRAVSKSFNNTTCSDSYIGDVLFYGQVEPFDGSRRDGATVQRRILEVEPGTQIPIRRAINFSGTSWLLGSREVDEFKGEAVREKYICQEAEGLANYKTLAQALDSTAQGVEAMAARVWVKTSSQVEIGSGKFNQLQIYFSRPESVTTDSIVTLNNSYYYVTEVYPSTAGHLVALSEEMDGNPHEVAQIKGETYDPITEEYSSGVRDVKVVRLRWQVAFDYFSQRTNDFKRGDSQLASAEIIPPGTTVTLSDGEWEVVANQSNKGVYLHHIRRA